MDSTDSTVESVVIKYTAMRDWVLEVAKGTKRRCLLLHGDTSVGKTTLIARTLTALGLPFVYIKPTCTAAGFRQTLDKNKDEGNNLLLDDCLNLMRDKLIVQDLTTAISPDNRTITRLINNRDHSFTYNGRIFITTNVALSETDSTLAGFRGRAKIELVDLTVEERIAVIRWLVDNPDGFLGYKEHEPAASHRNAPLTQQLTRNERKEVADLVIHVYGECGGKPNIRLYREYAISWRMASKYGYVGTALKPALDWKQHVRMEIEKEISQKAITLEKQSRVKPETALERINKECAVVRTILATTNERPEQLKLWHEKFPNSAARKFDRRKAEVKASVNLPK